MHQLAKEISGRQNSLWMNWEGEVIIDEIGASGTAQGRNSCYKSVMLPGVRGLGLGDQTRVKVYDFSNFSLRARIIPQGS